MGSQPDGEPKRGYSDKVKTKTDSSCQTSPPSPTPMNNSHKMLTVVSVLRKKLRGQVYYCRQHLLQLSILGPLTRRLILERSFISKRARDLLGLDAETQKEVLIKTFANELN